MGWNSTATAIKTGVTKARSVLWSQQFWSDGTHYQARVYGHTTITTEEYRGLTQSAAETLAASLDSITQNTYSVRWNIGLTTWYGNFVIEDSVTADVRRANEAGGYTVVKVTQTTTYSTSANSGTTITVEV